jgi:hypothetical protein
MHIEKVSCQTGKLTHGREKSSAKTGLRVASSHIGDCADTLLLRCAALDLNTSLHSIPTSLTPGTPASSQLRSAGSHVPHSESARARWSVVVVVVAAVAWEEEEEEGGRSNDRRMIGSARRAERCNTGENGIVGRAGGAAEEGDRVAEEVERCRVAELDGGLVACMWSDRDDCLRCGGFGVLSTSAAAPSAFPGAPPLELAGSRAAEELELEASRAEVEVETVASEVDNCEIDSNDDLSDSSEWSSASARLFI